MLTTYFRNAARAFRSSRLFSVINILGLSIGISAALVIFWVADYELSFDRFEPNRDRIFEVVQEGSFNGNAAHAGAVPGPLGEAVQNELTGLELAVPYFTYQVDGTAKVIVGGNKPTEFKKQTNIVYTTPEYFTLVPHRWLAGSPQASMSDPFRVVLTESRARLYFPNETPADVVGRQLSYDKMLVTVSGVVKDEDEHTDLGAAEFISHATIAKTWLQHEFMMNKWDDWMGYNHLYVKLAPGVTRARAEAQLDALYRKYNPSSAKSKDGWHLKLLALADIHFDPIYHSPGRRVASKSALYGLLAIAAFLLLLATINFINLSTAQATRRAKEIGVRKTMGGSRGQLIRLFLGETFFLVLVATALSMALTPVLIEAFSGFIPPDLHADWLRHPGSLLFLALLVPVLTVLSGAYPAFLLSGFNPVRVLKDQHYCPASNTSGARLRRILTVGQFVIAQFFVIATLLVGKQIYYGLNQDLGFRRTAILTFNTPWDSVATHKKHLFELVKAIPGVAMASRGFFSPGGDGGAVGGVSFKARPDIKADVLTRWGDSTYLRLYDIRLLAGRNLRNSDTATEVLINNTYARILGFNKPADALGQRLTFYGKKDMPIVGVMADFHEESMHEAIQPLEMTNRAGDIFHIRLASLAVAPGVIDRLQKAFHEVYPDGDLEYSFVDRKIAQWYKAEQDIIHLLYWATGLTIGISCLGLLGLVVYTTNSRTKEIGIRKVLGATVANVIAILSAEFLRLVLLASAIAIPVAWWAADRWLSNFAYRTPMSAWVFVAGGVGLLLVALATLSFQTIKTALANPVESLRIE
ncbi:MAG TPA: ABC transporter permease [Puia sp.]|nr:ABC transporter permease [Puia sp.]HVU97865.1 ABC transporter permease [Puia sp.]